jgi:hypothetical protein
MTNETHNSATCERADDLIAVLYGEASESEKRDFEFHLKQCGNCHAEFDAFAQVRESIGEWRDEALTGFVSSQVAPAPVRKSAIAALRQFFDLSPVWLKGAVGFAALVFCMLVALAVLRLEFPQEEISPVATKNPEAVFTKQDLERAVQEALAKQEREQPIAIAEPPSPRGPGVARADRTHKARRPFSKAEREQLAAELRLVGLDETDFEFPDR